VSISICFLTKADHIIHDDGRISHQTSLLGQVLFNGTMERHCLYHAGPKASEETDYANNISSGNKTLSHKKSCEKRSIKVALLPNY